MRNEYKAVCPVVLQTILLAMLLAMIVTYCLFPVLMWIGSQFIALQEQTLTICVDSVGEGGGSEVWIARQDDTTFACDLNSVPAMSEIRGECEYRLAADYGYGYNFLVSYGENSGTVLRISYTPEADSTLLFYCNPAGAVVTLTDGGKSWSFDSYAAEPAMRAVALQRTPGVGLAVYLISATLFLGVTALVYQSFRHRFWLALPSAKESFPVLVTTDSRDFSLDLLKALSAFLVIYVHSFLASTDGTVSYYNTPLFGGRMLIMTGLRWLALYCVPLFMLLSGCLCVRRTSLKKSFLSLLAPSVSFLLVMMVNLMLRRFYYGQTLTISDILSATIGIDLFWYWAMYIGLALLMPFLNLMWGYLERGQQDTLVLVLIVLTSAGSITNNLFPAYWQVLYPITYYYLGAWIQARNIHVRRGRIFAALVFVLCLETIRSFFDANGAGFNWSTFGAYNCSYNATPVVLSTVLIVLLIRGFTTRSRPVRSFIQNVSCHTLGVYFVSVAITDSLLYPLVLPYFPTAQQFLPVQIPIVLIDFLLALVVANIVDWAGKPISSWILTKVSGYI